MTKKYHIVCLFLLTGFFGFSQNSKMFDDVLYRADTVFYEEGTVKYISLYPKTKNAYSSIASKYELRKKVLQYDKCGNLRNITEVSIFKGQIESCHDYNFPNSRYETTDNLVKNVECEEVWVKPMITN